MDSIILCKLAVNKKYVCGLWGGCPANDSRIAQQEGQPNRGQGRKGATGAGGRAKGAKSTLQNRGTSSYYIGRRCIGGLYIHFCGDTSPDEDRSRSISHGSFPFPNPPPPPHGSSSAGPHNSYQISVKSAAIPYETTTLHAYFARNPIKSAIFLNTPEFANTFCVKYLT